MQLKKMSFAFSMPGFFFLQLSSIILSLSHGDRSTRATEIKVLNLCTQKHCENCSNSAFSICSNGALSNRCGDLCGCCHSCVQFRDIGESCGSQLAVRSFKNFEYSRSRVTILATTSCRKGLICKNFVCKRLHEKVNIERNDEESLDLRTNLITIVNPNDDKNDNDVTTRGIEWSTSTGIPWIITSTREMLSTFGTNTRGISGDDSEQELQSNVSFDPSGHLINLLVAGREFQLIYGYEILDDFNLLIESIDKNQTKSLVQEFEAKILHERIKDIIQYVNSDKKVSTDYKDIVLLPTSLKIENLLKNTNQRFSEPPSDSGVITVLQNFVLRPRTSKISKSRASLRKFRKKRDLNEREKSSDVKVEEKINDEYDGVSVYDIVNKTPRQIEDFGHWLIDRKVETSPEEKTRMRLNNDEIGSELNIHISGIPKMTNLDREDIEIGEKNDEIENYDDLEIFVSDANTDVPEYLTAEDKYLTNFTNSQISRNNTNNENNRITITKDDWINVGEKGKFHNNNYEFTFPENPVRLERDYYRDIDIIVNETVDELKAQLDRIETRAIIIENTLFDMMEKIDINERVKNYQSTETNFQSFGLVEPEKNNEFVANVTKSRQRKIVQLSNENSTYPSTKSPENKNFTIADTRSGQFHSNRSNRQWRTVSMKPNLSDGLAISTTTRRRLNRSKENKINEPEVIRRRSKTPRDREDSERIDRVWLPRRSSSMKFLQDPPTILGQRKFPIFLSSRDSNGRKFYNNPYNDPRFVSREQSGLVVSSNSPRERSVWPLNLVLNRALPADRRDRKSEEEIRIRGRSLERENPVAEESVILLETQIPKSLRREDSMISGDRFADGSMRFVKKYDDDEVWNWEDEQPSVNLFVADDQNYEFGISSGSRLSETLVLPDENSNVKTNRQESQDVDDGYSIFPAYLDYSERSETKVQTNDLKTTESSVNPGKNGRTLTRISRKKRSVINESLESQEFKADVKNKSVNFIKTIDSSNDNLSIINEKSKFPTNTANLSNKSITINSENLDSRLKNLSKKRSKRSVHMVDWLREAREYHDHLRQVRNAAMKTWLASREELADTNLTNVKLFTRELPSHLARYNPTIFQDHFESPRDEGSEEYPTEIRDSEDTTTDVSELLTDILTEDSSTREKASESVINAQSDVQVSKVYSSLGARKFTIITNGNSTIRIEEMPNNSDSIKWLKDNMAEGSDGSEINHEIPIIDNESDYFDHMYESFDGDDEEFDYEDPNLMMSGWLDRVDIIDSSSVEGPGNTEKLHVNTNEKEVEDSSSRFKRDSPLFLFKVKGNPSQDVLIWPSNWRDLIDRHLRLNHSRDTPPRTTKRRSYLRSGKIEPKILSATLKPYTEETRPDRDDKIPSSSETVIREENLVKESSADLDIQRRLQKGFDHRSRQSRRKNGSYRSNVGNYK